MVSTIDKSDDLQDAPQTGADQKTAHRPRWHANVLGLLALPLAILALEAVFSMAGIGQGEIVKPDPALGCRHIPNKHVTWRLEGFCRDKFNSKGMRDEEIPLAKEPGVKRIAFLGDSYTEGLQVQRGEIFAEKMRRSLNEIAAKSDKNVRYQSLNFGCSSYSTGQELLQYEREVRPYKPDLVVVLYTPGDTLENSINPQKRKETEARPYFYLDGNGRLNQDDSLLLENAAKLESTPMKEFLRANSTIFGAYTQMHLSMTMADKVFFRTTRLIDQIGAKIGGFFDKGQNKRLQDKTAPAVNPADQIEISAAVIKRLADEVESDGGEFVLMMYPEIYTGNSVYAQSRSRLATLAAQERFGYLDLSPAFNAVADPHSMFVQVHFAKSGHDLTTRTLTTFLKDSGYLQ